MSDGRGKRNAIAMALTCMALGAVTAQDGRSAEWKEPFAVTIACNPFKLFMGLVNAEVDLRVSKALSLHVFSEWLVGEWALSKSEHPFLVVRGGPRLHLPFLEHPDFDALAGPYCSYAWSEEASGDEGFGLGLELGLKYRLWRGLSVFGKGMVMYLPGSGRILPGLEALLAAGFGP
jgi:hypothetical protein